MFIVVALKNPVIALPRSKEEVTIEISAKTEDKSGC